MTLTKEEIEMIEREAKEYSEIFAMHDRESVCAGFMEGAAVYYHIVKDERERAGKLMEALVEVQAGSLTGQLTRPDMNKVASKAINEYNNKP